MAAPKGTRPPAAGKGRKKGTPNKITGTLKDMILKALDEAGGVEYLRKQAIKNPSAFMTLIGKVLPQDIKAEHSGRLTLEALVMASMKTIDGDASEVREETPRLLARRV